MTICRNYVNRRNGVALGTVIATSSAMKLSA